MVDKRYISVCESGKRFFVSFASSWPRKIWFYIYYKQKPQRCQDKCI